jgi:hypothetical protein
VSVCASVCVCVCAYVCVYIRFAALQGTPGLSSLKNFEVFRSHRIKHTHTYPVGLLWTSDQLIVETAIYTTHNKHNRQTSTPSAPFEPAIPAIKWPQTYASDRTATGIDLVCVCVCLCARACVCVRVRVCARACV